MSNTDIDYKKFTETLKQKVNLPYQTLKLAMDKLSDPKTQRAIISEQNHIPAFGEKLKEIDLLPLKPFEFGILQVNVGYMCNQMCAHCHVDAGPDRTEIMRREVMQSCLDALDKAPFHTVDITGGAPELNPNFEWFIEELSKRDLKIIVRSNLTVLLFDEKFENYPEYYKKHNVEVIASLPCYTEDNTDKQRGKGVFDKSLEALKRLNKVGYGQSGTGLNLHLVYNPGGAVLPGSQEGLEADYKKQLKENHNIVFNHLYTITNMPISRFLMFLEKKGQLEDYMTLLANAFNPSAAMGVMCRTTLSIGWDGTIYDCDFNQILDMKVSCKPSQNIANFDAEALFDRNIAINQHCYGCTAGAGSSCQGSLA